MASEQGPKKKDQIAKHIDKNLNQVFSDLEGDDMPDQINALLASLRVQDDEIRARHE